MKRSNGMSKEAQVVSGASSFHCCYCTLAHTGLCCLLDYVLLTQSWVEGHRGRSVWKVNGRLPGGQSETKRNSCLAAACTTTFYCYLLSLALGEKDDRECGGGDGEGGDKRAGWGGWARDEAGSTMHHGHYQIRYEWTLV